MINQLFFLHVHFHKSSIFSPSNIDKFSNLIDYAPKEFLNFDIYLFNKSSD